MHKGDKITYTKSSSGNHIFAILFSSETILNNSTKLELFDWVSEITLNYDGYLAIILVKKEHLDSINLKFTIRNTNSVHDMLNNKVDIDGISQITPENTTFIDIINPTNLYTITNNDIINEYAELKFNEDHFELYKIDNVESNIDLVFSEFICEESGYYTTTISDCNIPIANVSGGQVGFIFISELDYYNSSSVSYIWVQNAGNTKTFELVKGVTYYLGFRQYNGFNTFDNGKLGQFKFQLEKGQDSTEYEVPSGKKYALKNQLLDLKDIKILKQDIDELLNSQYSNPLKHISGDYNLSACFKSIACIGDSLTQGTYDRTNGSLFEADAVDFYNFPMNIARITGATVYNLGRAGAAANDSADSVQRLISWHYWADTNGYWDIINTNKPVAYIIALGTNDIGYFDDKFSGDPNTDIDINNLQNTNRSSSVGGYAHIIQYIYTIQPKAKIFCVGLPNTRQGLSANGIAMNTKLRSICEKLNCYFIDLSTYWLKEASEISYFNTHYKNGGHLNALGYNLFARVLCTYIDYIIRTNINDFQNIQFIGTNMDYVDS